MQGCIYEKSNKKMYIFLKNLYKIKKKSHMNHTYLNIKTKFYLKKYTQMMLYFLKN
jgi:hypothetical protein